MHHISPASALLVLMGLLARPLPGQEAKIIEVGNVVQSAKPGKAWTQAMEGQNLAVKDQIRARQRSRAAVKLTGLYTLRMDAWTTVELTEGLAGADKATLDLSGGAGFIFSREREGEITIRTPAANGALRGTQLFVRVSEGGKSFYQVLEGTVVMSNAQGDLTLGPGEAGEAVPGRPPVSTAVIETHSLLQWALYYPAVIGPREFQLTAAEQINGFAWTKLAELEFSFGCNAAADDALKRGVDLAPQNAQAHALSGFVWSAQKQDHRRAGCL